MSTAGIGGRSLRCGAAVRTAYQTAVDAATIHLARAWQFSRQTRNVTAFEVADG